MQLHFLKRFPWEQETHFIEKIWKGMNENLQLTEIFNSSFLKIYNSYPYQKKPEFNVEFEKIHTIRADIKDRWHPGRLIHFEQWTGKPYKSKCYHFAPVIPCISTQKIEIKYNKGGGVNVFIDGNFFFYRTSWGLEWDKKTLENMQKLAFNDGFESITDFFRWFNKDFKGKIIHWTDFKY